MSYGSGSAVKKVREALAERGFEPTVVELKTTARRRRRTLWACGWSRS